MKAMQLFMKTFETNFVQIRQKYFKFWERKNEFLIVKELSSNLRAFRIEILYEMLHKEITKGSQKANMNLKCENFDWSLLFQDLFWNLLQINTRFPITLVFWQPLDTLDITNIGKLHFLPNKKHSKLKQFQILIE